MLASLRRKLNIGGMGGPSPPSFPQNGSLQSLLSTEGMFIDMPLGRTGPGGGGGPQGGNVLAPFTMEELGFGAGHVGAPPLAFGPGNIPAWLQEHVRPFLLSLVDTDEEGGRGLTRNSLSSSCAQSLNDLGIPMNGSEGIFLQMAGHNNGWAGDFAPMPEAW
jgi:hypothetical protein